MRIRAALSVLFITALAAGLVHATPPGQIRVQVNLVNLFATVRDKHKAIVTGLKMDDFQVFEDGQPQEITNFSAESNLPITLGLLIDTSGSEEFMLSTEKEMGSRFLRRVMRKGDLAMIMLTDAEDTGSKLKLQDAIEAAQRTDTVVHILLVAADGGDQGVARKLTDETGGRMIVVRNEKNLEQAFDQISEELRSQYTIGYVPANKARDGSYRKIRVDMKNKEYSTLTRRG